MTQTWQQLLEQQAQHSIQFDQLASTSNVMPLTQLGILQVSGDDSQQFLQNLLTNDVTDLAINQAQSSGLCNPKGRLLALFLLIRSEAGYLLIMPKTLSQTIQQRLSMYILRSKVTISDESDKLACLGLCQANYQQNDFLNLPETLYSGLSNNELLHIKLPATIDRWLTIGPIEQLASLCQSLIEKDWLLNPEAYWTLLDINAGLAQVVPETREKFTPQQINLDLTNGVSFKKGCYPGQEVVARLHYLGQPSRRMFIAEAQTTERPIEGDEFMTSNGNVAGHIVSAQHQDQNTLKVLVSLKLSEQAATLVLADSTPLKLLSELSA